MSDRLQPRTHPSPSSVEAVASKVAVELRSHERTRPVANAVPAPDEGPLRVAFTGPYSAGKSLLIGALVGLPAEELEALVDAPPKTSEVTPYAWRQHTLLDLPGTLSGIQDHDAAAHEGMRRADVLVIVTTVELSGPEETRAIHELLGREGFADRAVVVVNKMNAESSDPAVIRAEMEARLGAFARTTDLIMTDVRDYVDAANFPGLTDDERAILRAESGVEDLISSIEQVLSSGKASLRAGAQGYELRRVLSDARAAWDFGKDEEEFVALSARLSDALSQATARLRTGIEESVETLRAAIQSVGHDLSRTVSETDGSVPASAQKAADAKQVKAAERFQADVNALEGDFVTFLTAETDVVVTAATRFEREYEPQRSSQRRTSWLRGDKAADTLFAEAAKRSSQLLKKLADSGTQKGDLAHDLAKKVNTIFGRDPKPYVHKNLALNITKASERAGWAASMLGPAIDLKGLADDQLRRRKIDKRRRSIVQTFEEEASRQSVAAAQAATDWAADLTARAVERMPDGFTVGTNLMQEREVCLARIDELDAEVENLLSDPDAPVFELQSE